MTREALEKVLSKIAGTAVEITIRGDRRFTWSVEPMNAEAADKLAAFARQDRRTMVEIQHEEEFGSFVFVDVAA